MVVYEKGFYSCTYHALLVSGISLNPRALLFVLCTSWQCCLTSAKWSFILIIIIIIIIVNFSNKWYYWITCNDSVSLNQHEHKQVSVPSSFSSSSLHQVMFHSWPRRKTTMTTMTAITTSKGLTLCSRKEKPFLVLQVLCLRKSVAISFQSQLYSKWHSIKFVSMCVGSNVYFVAQCRVPVWTEIKVSASGRQPWLLCKLYRRQWQQSAINIDLPGWTVNLVAHMCYVQSLVSFLLLICNFKSKEAAS